MRTHPFVVAAACFASLLLSGSGLAATTPPPHHDHDFIQNPDDLNLLAQDTHKLAGSTVEKPIATGGEQVPSAPRQGFGRYAFRFNAGLTSTGSTAARGYYDGYSYGPLWESGVRYFFTRKYPRSPRLFFGATYGQATPKAPSPTLLVTNSSGASTILPVHPIHIGRLGVECGLTSSMTGSGSYYEGMIGLTRLMNTVDDVGSDTRTAIRMGFGRVIGISPRLGVEVLGTIDEIFTSWYGRVYYPHDYHYESRYAPQFKGVGGLYTLSVGVTWSR